LEAVCKVLFLFHRSAKANKKNILFHWLKPTAKNYTALFHRYLYMINCWGLFHCRLAADGKKIPPNFH